MGFEYLKVKKMHTYMQTQPAQFLTEKHVEGLKFKLKSKGTKKSTIIMKSSRTEDDL